MKKVIFSVCIIASTILIACNEQAEYDSSLPTFPATSASGALTDTSKPVFADSISAQAIKAGQPTLSPKSMQPKTTESIALNPKHGEPGHRCDIAVGAPLNSPVQPSQQTVPTVQPVPIQPKTLTNSIGTAKVNPPHGQPGHDCAIPVGAPLKG